MPHPTRSCPRSRVWTAAVAEVVMLVSLAAVPGAGPARAQSVIGEPMDLRFTVRDATTDQPARPERVTIAYIAGRLSTIVDTGPDGAEFTLAAVPVKDIGQYIVTVWYQGVPYWWQKRGSDLMAGPTAFDVFSVSASTDVVTITGLNLIVQYRETTADLELMVEIDNPMRPQTTVNRSDGTFTVQLPAGSTAIEATYQRGPEPTPVKVTLTGTSAAVAMPLTPGANRLHLKARARWNGSFDLPVGSDLPVAAWSLLTSPASVSVEGSGLQAPDEQTVPRFVRRAGPALAAGQTFAVRLDAGTPAGEPEPLFEQTTPEADPAPAAAGADGKVDGGDGFPVPLAVLALVVIIGVVVVARRRRS